MLVSKLAILSALALAATAAQAQAPPRPAPEPKLAFDREVFEYPGTGRNDPFRPLSGTEAMGPLYEDLTLRAIIYIAHNPALSVATVNAGSKKLHRLRRGDVLGNARVAAIEPKQVKWLVQSYGMIREEIMPLATRVPSAEIRSSEGGQDQTLQRLFQQELLRALQGTRADTTPRPPVRRDTTSAPPARPPR
jgi:hypothetical protein